jgi:dolichol-phosphate mannosyltransferase
MKLAVIIPSYKVKKHILGVLNGIQSNVSRIYVVDDACPEQSGKWVQENSKDTRVTVLYHQENAGVGGAMKTGYLQAMKDGMDIMVKVDGDGQMDPTLIDRLAHAILKGDADYVKGSRFYYEGDRHGMPWLRVLGNSGLTFLLKIASGYWSVSDPTNGFTAIHRTALSFVNLDKISNSYFFESDLLCRLYLVKAVVRDFPMKAKYGDEESSLNISRVLFEFPPKLIRRFIKRFLYSYFFREINIASFYFLFGFGMLLFGFIFGSINWFYYSTHGDAAPTGTVMLAALPILLGLQLVLSGITYDIFLEPKNAIQEVH